MPKVTGLKLELQKGTTDTLVAKWSFSRSHTKHYTVKWYYATGNGVWFDGGSSDVTLKNATYSIPSNATSVRVKVKPVSKKRKVGCKEKAYWTGTSVSKTYTVSSGKPNQISSPPEVSLERNTNRLNISLNNITDKNANQIEFEIVKGTAKFASKTVTVTTQRAIWSPPPTLQENGKYRVRCRAINIVGSAKVEGDWSPYSSEFSSSPSVVTNVKCESDTKTSVKVTWREVSTAATYTVEAVTDPKYFDTGGSTNTVTVEGTTAYVTGLSQGEEWFFRVKATNEDDVDSGWSTIVSIILATKPAAPTTWSSTTTAVVGEEVKLHWVHNSEDGSKQKAAMIRLIVDGNELPLIPLVDDDYVVDENDEEQDNPIFSYTLNLSPYKDGAKILWSIQTKGVADEFSEWSIQRTIDLYAPPWLSLSLNDDFLKWLWDSFNFETDTIYTAEAAELLTHLPYTIKCEAGPTTQTPIAYHISVVAEDAYETEDHNGEPRIVSAGDEVFSRVFNISDNPFKMELSAGDITLENNQNYTVKATVSMNSGLTAEASESFMVVWDDDTYEPDASIVIDEDALTAHVTPFCVDEDEKLIEDVVLSVYRREYDGTLTEIETDIPNDGVSTITDPHPALDYARYRVVARNINTNVIGYEDLPGEPIGEPGVVIQWDEEWSNYIDEENPDAFEIPSWTGSMIRLPYNVDVTEKHDLDVSLISYIGRKHPVTYYGTHRGEGMSLKADFDKNDNEMIYALRRLANYAGDVYVREPSGIGYWANVKVSMPITHRSLTIPVSLEVTRVEGGI